MDGRRYRGVRVRRQRWAAFRIGLGGLAARAALAIGVLVLAGAVAGPARAVPLGPGLADEAGRLPQVLSAKDVRLYREIFALGGPGRWAEADALLAQVDNEILVGHALAQRYLHPTAYWTPFHELRDWLAAYHDHPDAPRLYRLAQTRRPAGAGPVRRASYGRGDYGLPAGGGVTSVGSIETLSTRASTAKGRAILRRVRWNVLNTRLSITEDYLAQAEVRASLRGVERDRGLAMVAAGWYYYGNDEKALALAGPAAARAGVRVPMAHWIAGLASWRRGALPAALGHFEALGRAGNLEAGARAAGAYWAARAALRLRDPAAASGWLRRAAAQPGTFYGQLAAESLGLRWPLGFDPAQPAAGGAGLERLTASAAGRRALALLQVGQRDRARRELLGLDGWDDPALVNAVIAAADRGGLPALAFRLGRRLVGHEAPGWSRATVQAALYPIPPWRPATGFRIDRALLYALMRRESRFRPDARSGAGARGLMQLMPATASYMARRENFEYSHRALLRPDLNLDLAQRYLGYLLKDDAVDGNLVHLATAYNGGPGNLRKWLRRTAHHGDPLLFIESLPSRETRHFIERIFTNLWAYRARLGQAAPSRAALASGDWPSYVSQDTAPEGQEVKEVAQR